MILDVFLVLKIFELSYASCLMLLFIAYYPCCFGALLNLLISSIRYTLARKAAHNIQPSNSKVLKSALLIFFIFVILQATYFGLNAIWNISFSYFVEVCAYPDQTPRPYSTLNGVVLQMPITFALISLMVDMQMIQFLKKTILPLNTYPPDMDGKGNVYFKK
jgi:hypothetical protein